MAFEPFGFRFEVKATSSVATVKAKIRARKRRWLDPTLGARGWIVGPFICLWLSATDRRGPVLFGRISDDGLGTRIRGRAGSDLDGFLLLAVLAPIMMLPLYQAVVSGDFISRQTVLSAVVSALLPFALWRMHKNRHKAQPLVRFLEDAASLPDQSFVERSAPANVTRNLTLNITGVEQHESAAAEGIRDALVSLSEDGFVILSESAETYIQAMQTGRGYLLEMREGHRDRHYRAERVGGRRGDANAFTFDETLGALMAFAAETPMPPMVRWRLLTLSS